MIQADGKIVAAGGHDEEGGAVFNVALARFLSDGSLDPNFGTGGKVTTMVGWAFATSLAIQRDGKVVAGGVAGRLDSGQFALFRFKSSGVLDQTFGSAGVVRTSFDPGDFQTVHDVAIDHNGTIVAAGLRENTTADFNFNDDFALAGYRRDGSLDKHFGEDGKVTSDFGAREQIDAIALERSGSLIAGGTYIVRYDKKGRIDSSFGTDGKVERSAQGIAIQRDGKIVGVNGTEIARYNRDGSLDTSFGNGGTVPTG